MRSHPVDPPHFDLHVTPGNDGPNLGYDYGGRLQAAGRER